MNVEEQLALIDRVKRDNPTHDLELHPCKDAMRCRGCGAEVTGEDILAGPVRLLPCEAPR